MPWPELADELAKKKQLSLYRHRDSWESLCHSIGTSQNNSSTNLPCNTIRQKNGRSFHVFCSNDYLGLSTHPDVIDSFRQSSLSWGVGATASHLVNGHSVEHQQLEQELAAFTGRDRALLFSTGYMANIGVIGALLNKHDALFHDRLNHASLLDAGQLSGARAIRYHHKDLDSLERLLSKSSARRKLVVSDGVFSMDGDIAPLPAIIELAKRYDAKVMVDDAHGFGCLGPKGEGCIGAFDLSQEQLPIVMGTLSKAFGLAGAFVVGDEQLIETLIQNARTYIYTTALPPAIASAARESLKIIKTDHQRRAKLNALIDQFKQQCAQANIPLLDSNTAIQPVIIGDSATAIAISEQLADAGFLVKAIRPPTVAPDTARLRITLSATHAPAVVTELVATLSHAMQQHPPFTANKRSITE